MHQTKIAGYFSRWATIYFDGGAEPNPGVAGSIGSKSSQRAGVAGGEEELS